MTQTWFGLGICAEMVMKKRRQGTGSTGAGAGTLAVFAEQCPVRINWKHSPPLANSRRPDDTRFCTMACVSLVCSAHHLQQSVGRWERSQPRAQQTSPATADWAPGKQRKCSAIVGNHAPLKVGLLYIDEAAVGIFLEGIDNTARDAQTRF